VAIDPSPILCDYDDGRPAVALVRDGFVLGRWEPCCQAHADRFAAADTRYQFAYLHGHGIDDDPPEDPDHDPTDVGYWIDGRRP
jgi:hypothetical protein